MFVMAESAEIELSVVIRSASPGARANPEGIRTAQFGSREKPESWHVLSREPAVSGSDLPGSICQNLTVSREFLGLRLFMLGKSLPPQTQWRWWESRANSSLRVDPCSAGKIQGDSLQPDAASVIGAEFSERFRGSNDGFPAIENRRLLPTSREFAATRSGL